MSVTKKILCFFILISLVFEISKFYSFTIDYSTWQYGDWLINYQGGFVRRGFIGEILYFSHKLSFIDLDKIIFSFVISIYIFISFFLFKSIKYIENNYENILIFLSPGFFIYPIMNSEVIGRKDILLIFCIALIVFFEKKINNKYLFSSLVVAIIILCFSHASFIFYSPYLIFLYVLIKQNRNLKIKRLEIFSIILTILITAISIQYFSGSEIIVKQICLSVKEFTHKNCGIDDQLLWLGMPLDNRLSLHLNFYKALFPNNLFVYSISIILVFFFISIRLKNSKFNNLILNSKFITPFFIFILLFIFTSPVYILSRDWGRYIHLSYSATFFIYIYCLKEKILTFKKYNFLWLHGLNKISLVLFISLFCFSWTFPFYDANSFKITLKKPIRSLLKKLDKNN